MPDSYDIVIIGAGPAGSTLARLIDTARFKVLLVDGSCGREKVCGGLISPDAQDILARWDISLPKDVLVSPQLFSVRTIDLADGLTRHYRRSYMNVNRRRFDEFLLDLVPSSVDLERARCRSLRREGEGFALDLGTREVYCRYVVGADGASSVVRRSLFRERKIVKYTAIQQWFEARGENPYYSCVFDSETSPGCSWIFFKDGKLVFGGAFDRENGRAAFEEQKRKLVEQGIVARSVFASPVRTEACLVSRPTLDGGIFLGRDGAFLAGEAAGLISPSSFEGISYALASSEALADAFNAAPLADAFNTEPHPAALNPEPRAASRVLRRYRRGTRSLALKIKLRCVKRPFMYDPLLRRIVMRSGISAIELRKQEVQNESKVTV